MYHDLKQHYWWRRMKKEIVGHVTRCLSCQQIKYEHKRPGGLLQKIEILKWKWERITIDFVSRKKSYTNRKVRDVAFMEDERVLLRVSPMKGVMRFWKKGKFHPRYVGPFEVLERVGEVAYRLAFPPRLTGVHPVVHVSMLRKYYKDPSHVLDFSSVQLDENLAYEEEPVAILDGKIQKMRSKSIASVKV
ncbi:uncharacterized protein [Nicotiana tomentosiformis]|uniref:uncharacterized protein n=1 Tax=Nicotiana tomentosiformis TaxID=4098 RepID=UPI00388CC3F6